MTKKKSANLADLRRLQKWKWRPRLLAGRVTPDHPVVSLFFLLHLLLLLLLLLHLLLFQDETRFELHDGAPCASPTGGGPLGLHKSSKYYGRFFLLLLLLLLLFFFFLLIYSTVLTRRRSSFFVPLGRVAVGFPRSFFFSIFFCRGSDVGRSHQSSSVVDEARRT